jgi:S1-C subfamily serine protease
MFLGGGSGSSRIVASDADLDVAILEPTFPIDAEALHISINDDLKIGAQVSTWGFPGGYTGLNPMLSVGYLSGIQAIKPIDNKIEKQWVVNAAFNRGNSGGPLLLVETGEVIGIVSSKAAPFSLESKLALQALKGFNAGFIYTESRSDGTKVTLTEAQVVGMVLEDLQNQVQLVIGNAVRSEDLRVYLRSLNIDP